MMLRPGSTKCRHVWSTELVSKELAATEEAKKRRRVEDSAAHKLQKAKEEAARLAGHLEEARDSEISLLSLGKSLTRVACRFGDGFGAAVNFKGVFELLGLA